MILKHLKKQTETLHQQTEENNLAKYILDHSVTKEQYNTLLKQNYYAYAKIDRILNDHNELLNAELRSFADGSKSESLSKDLSLRRVSVPQEIDSELQNVKAAFLMGMIYVVEGSMMGGLLIRKNLESCSNLKAVEEHHFFGKSAPEVMQRWKAFTAAVENHEYSEAEAEEAVKGANYAFSIFKESYSV